MTHAETLLRDAARELKDRFGAEATAEVRGMLKNAGKMIRERDRQLRSTPRLIKGFLVWEGGKQRPPQTFSPIGLAG